MDEEDAPCWGMYKIGESFAISAVFMDNDNESILYFLDKDYPVVQFATFNEFLAFVLDVALSQEFRLTALPGDDGSETKLGEWLPRDNPPSSMLETIEYTRLILGDLPVISVPHALVCGQSLETHDDGSILWKFNGDSPRLSRQNVIDLLLLTLSDPRTESRKYQYQPDAIRAVSEGCLNMLRVLGTEVNESAPEVVLPEVLIPEVMAEVEKAPVVVAESVTVELLAQSKPVATAPDEPTVITETKVPVAEVKSPEPTSHASGDYTTRADEIIHDFETALRNSARAAIDSLC